MKPELEMQTRIKSYVLGETDEAESEAIKKMMLTDDELFEELLMIQDQVID